MERIPEIQIERIPILTQSDIYTLKKQKFQIGKTELDQDTGTYYINIYYFGNIVKKIFFDKDERLVKLNWWNIVI